VDCHWQIEVRRLAVEHSQIGFKKY
jgi:hypothetical protein